MGVSGPPHPKNGHFLPQKSHCHFWTKISFVGLDCLVQLAPPTLFCRCPTEKKHVLQGMEARNMVFRDRPTQKMAIFAQTWPINSNFWPKTVLFGCWWSVHSRSTLFCRCLTQWIHTQYSMEINTCVAGVWLHVLHGIEWVFHFLPKNCLKMSILGLKHCFIGLERSVQGPPTLFCRCLTQIIINCLV